MNLKINGIEISADNPDPSIIALLCQYLCMVEDAKPGTLGGFNLVSLSDLAAQGEFLRQAGAAVPPEGLQISIKGVPDGG